jgi:hypothetical protein
MFGPRPSDTGLVAPPAIRKTPSLPPSLHSSPTPSIPSSAEPISRPPSIPTSEHEAVTNPATTHQLEAPSQGLECVVCLSVSPHPPFGFAGLDDFHSSF